MDGVYVGYYCSPIGDLEICVEKGLISRVRLVNKTMDMPKGEAHPLLKEVFKWFDSYFSGCFAECDLPLIQPRSTSESLVRNALSQIHAGKTISYGELAEMLGKPRSWSRGAASVLAHNPLLILIPCHRVIGADGSISGYAGGVEAKRWLLRHEGYLS